MLTRSGFELAWSRMGFALSTLNQHFRFEERKSAGRLRKFVLIFFFNDTTTTEIYTLSLHDALPISGNPAGTTVSFSVNPVTPGQVSIVTINNTNALAAGAYDIKVNGVAGTVKDSTVVSIRVNTGLVAPTVMAAPANNATGVEPLAQFNWSAVPSATTYTLEISTSNDFSIETQAIPGISTVAFQLLTPLAENTVYYWRVRGANSCGSGPFSAINIFKTGSTICKSSTNVPLDISDGPPSEITSVITIPAGEDFKIVDLNVSALRGTHTFMGDVKISLTSPANTTVVLFNGICSSSKNFNLSLD